MTKVICLLGGPGCGKSTTASGLYFEMKKRGESVELVREYVKNWAWERKKITPYDQSYLFSKQAKSEKILFSKVDYIITDSPVILSTIYHSIYNNSGSLEELTTEYLALSILDEVEHKYFFLNRAKKYDTRGRYETEEQAREIDKYILNYLKFKGFPYNAVDGDHDQKVKNILKILGIV